MTIGEVARRHCWLSRVALLLGLIAASAAIPLGTTASASAAVGAETRVGAFNVVGEVPVDPPEHIAPVQRLGEAGPRVVTVVANGVAANTADKGVDLYRHVSPGELADIGKNGFRPGAGSLDGKWFAESGGHATQWGKVLNGGTGSVVKVRVPTSFGNELMRLEKLDGIGPARYVEPHQLDQLNRYGWELWP